MKHSHTMGDRFRALIAYDPLAGLHHKKRRQDGGRVNLAAHIAEQAKAVDRNPSEPQKAYGNYRKGHVKVHGLDISIENPRGSWREGGPPEKRWRSRLPHHYGYIRKTEGGDGDHVDCYIGPHLKAPNVFVIDQHHLKDGKPFDEHKCFIGFGSKAQAREAYYRAFSDGRGKERIGHIETMSVPDFKSWLAHSDTTKPIKSRRRGYADGGGVDDLSDADQAAMSPETYVNPVVKNTISHLATLPQRAIQNAQYSLDTGTYDPAPTLEAATLPMGAGIAGVPAKAGEAVLGAGPIRAYHGTPHSFDAFDTSKIGTGEGAQAYGHGLYFAENEGVAQSYRDALTKFAGQVKVNTPYREGMLDDSPRSFERFFAARFKENKGDLGKTVEQLQGDLTRNPKDGTVTQALDFANNPDHNFTLTDPNPGNMYEVNINADPEHFLDWDKPLTEQHPQTQDAVKRAMGSNWDQFKFANAGDAVKRGFIAPGTETTAARLSESGVPGIKYLDQGSRGAGDGSRNYVVFNDKLIDILKKYGITGAVATGMASEIMDQGKQHFASGGRVHMADGGVPAFDDTQPVDSGPPPFEATQPVETPSSGISSYVPKAISDIPHEIYQAGSESLGGVKDMWDTMQQRHADASKKPFLDPSTTLDSLKDVADVGKGVVSAASLPTALVTGTARSAIGHPMAEAEHLVGTIINPKVAAQDNPDQMYQSAKGDVDLAMSAAAAKKAPLISATPAPLKNVPAPTTGELFKAAENNYSNMHGYGVEVHPQVTSDVADNIFNELHTQGYRDYLAPKTFRAVEELKNPIGQNSTTQDIEGVRRALNKAAADPAERDAARRAIGEIDGAMANLQQQHVAVNPQFADRVGQEAAEARANYAAAKRSEMLDELNKKASRQANAAGSGTGIDNATRQRIKSVLDNPKKLRGFSDAEKDQMEQIVKGTFTGNAARLLGKFSPSGVVSGALSAGAGFAAHGPLGAVVLPTVGYIAKKAGDASTAAQVAKLSRLVRARSPLGKKAAINAAAQSVFAQPTNPAMLPAAGVSAANLQLPYRGANLGPMQGPAPSYADDKQP